MVEIKKLQVTLHIANRAFSAMYQHRQIVALAFKMNKIKKNTTFWLSVIPIAIGMKDYRFPLPYLPYTNLCRQL